MVLKYKVKKNSNMLEAFQKHDQPENRRVNVTTFEIDLKNKQKTDLAQ